MNAATAPRLKWVNPRLSQIIKCAVNQRDFAGAQTNLPSDVFVRPSELIRV